MADEKSDRTPEGTGPVAYKGRRVPGPEGAPVQVRPAGAESTRDDRAPWDARDEASDESFPASDASAKY